MNDVLNVNGISMTKEEAKAVSERRSSIQEEMQEKSPLLKKASGVCDELGVPLIFRRAFFSCGLTTRKVLLEWLAVNKENAASLILESLQDQYDEDNAKGVWEFRNLGGEPVKPTTPSGIFSPDFEKLPFEKRMEILHASEWFESNQELGCLESFVMNFTAEDKPKRQKKESGPH